LSQKVKYELIGTYDVARLNKILTKEIPEATGTTVMYTPARNNVKLYRVTYTSVIPEQHNRPAVTTGLIAVPETGAREMPMVSYQHGTVMGQYEVPSFPEKSFETRLMVAQFAGQGYVVIAADYIGLADSEEKDSYIVMGTQQQDCFDMYEASREVLRHMNISTTNFFVTGWSQGGVVTMSFLERLENLKVPVTAAGTASAQCDGYVMTSVFLNFPRKIDAYWVSAVYILTAFSFEEYYQVPGLAAGLFNPDQYDLARRVYMKDTTITSKEFPSDLHKLIRKEYFDATYFKQSAYGQLISTMHPYRWVVSTPVKMYYGEIDECLTIGLARLPMEYQKAIGNNKVEAYSAGADATHRITYARAAAEWKKWFDELCAVKK
jgi:pimeloyl-ACP methyl ester carboxylesterase